MKTRLICAAALIAAFASAMTGCASFGDNFLAYTYVPDVLTWTTKSSDKTIYDRAYKCQAYMSHDANIFYPDNVIPLPGYKLIGPLPYGKNKTEAQVWSHIYSSSLDITKNTSVEFYLYFSIHNHQAKLTVDKVTYLEQSGVSRMQPLWNKVQTDSMTEIAVNLENKVRQCIGE